MTDDRADDRTDGGPVPVRDLMRRMAGGRAEPTTPAREPAWKGVEEAFDADGEQWIARAAGTGAYGTGRLGQARLVAVHFFRESDPRTPLREALVPTARFPHLRPEELRELLAEATPIETKP